MKHKFLIPLIIAFSVKGQIVRPLMGVGYNRHTEFNNSSYFNIKTGVELNLKNYIKPEIEVNYFFGGIGEEINYNNQDAAVDVFSKKFSVLNIGFSPKIVLFKD